MNSFDLNFNIHVYIHNEASSSVVSKLDSILTAIGQLTQKETLMGQELDNLTAQVTASTTVQDSAMVLLTGLKTALDAAIAAGNPAALQTLSDSLGAESSKMAAAITANTPAGTGGGGPTPAAASRSR